MPMKKQINCFPKIFFILIFILIFQNVPLRAEIYTSTIDFNRTWSPQQLSSSLERVYQKTLDSGISNFTPYSLLLIKESQEALKKKDYERAEILSDYAQKLSPDLPPVYIAQAKVRWSKNKIFVHHLVKGYVKAFLKKIQDIEALSFMLFTNLSIITAAFLLTLGLFAIISMKKYFRMASHDLRHFITRAVPDKALWVMVLTLFLLPVLLGFSVSWVFVYWIILLFSYLCKREQLAIIGFLLLFAFMPLVVSVTCFSLYIPQSNVVKLLWDANYGYLDRQDIERLEKFHRQYPDDQDILFSLALVHKKENNYKTSEQYYEKLIALNPSFYKAHINMGNVYFATGRWQEALDQYKEAISVAPLLSSAAHFNLARAYQQKFMFKEAEKELSESKKKDSSRIDSYLKKYSRNYNRLIIDETIFKKSLWKKGLLYFSEQEDLTGKLWNLFFVGVPLPYGLPAVFLAMLLCWVLSRKDKFRIATECKICGKPICKRCEMRISAEIMCYQCQNFFQRKEKIDFKLKEKKFFSIRQYLKSYKKTGNLLSLLFPGACHIWKGQPIKGIIFLFLFFIFFLKIISVIVLDGPWGGVGSFKFLEVPALMMGLLFFWVLLVVDASRLRGKDQEVSLYLK